MTYRHGFSYGTLGGVLLTLLARGYILTFEFTELIQALSWFTLFVVFVLANLVTAYRVWKRKSYFDTTEDGVILGISFGEGIMVFLLQLLA